jgi:nucleotidyltransferase substrate binding protein (TIGR01987 family)
MTKTDIRWVQRFQNFQQALRQLEAATRLSQQRALSDLEQQGLIQSFEYTHELAWNLLKDYLEYQGVLAGQIIGSRDATRESFRNALIVDGNAWMDMIASRNKSSHTYNKGVANDIAQKILNSYFPLFCDLETKMKGLLPQ